MAVTIESACCTDFCLSEDVDPVFLGQQGDIGIDQTYQSSLVGQFVPAGFKTTTETVSGNSFHYTSNLPRELDILSELPLNVFARTDAKKFLLSLERAIVFVHQSMMVNLTLSKLYVSEYSESGFVLEWIFDSFRMYFSFDDDGNYWGTVVINNDEGEFSNRVIKIQNGKEAQLAQTVLENVITLLG